MSYASFGGQAVASVSLMIPWTGAWVADVDFVSSAAIPSSGPFVLGNMTLHGGVWRQATRWGQVSARLAGGKATLSKRIPAKGYSLPGGLMASTIASDVGVDTGESVSVPAANDRQLTFWSRVPGPGGATLTALFGDDWWVDANGTFQCAPRSPGAVTSTFTATAWKGGGGIITVATEDPASWMPGSTFGNAQVTTQQTIAQVRHFYGRDGALRTRVLVSPGDRLRGEVANTVKAGAPLNGVYKYQIVDVTPLGFDVLPTGNGPPLQRIPGGTLGPTTSLAMTGQTVLVVFEEGDESKPIVLSVSIPPTALVDAVLANGGGPVAAAAPIVATLVAP